VIEGLFTAPLHSTKQKQLRERIALGTSAVTKLALILHVIAGTIALFAGIVAVSSRKGARTHRVSGTVFFVSTT